MERNWDTIREILMQVEKCTLPIDQVRLSNFPSERAGEISYHIILLIEAGLVSGKISQSIGPEPKDFIAQRLTWSGHEFLDSIRSDGIWERTKKKFVNEGASMTFELVKSVSAEFIKSALYV